MGSHSVMLKPDSVKRVRPPTTMMPKTSAEQPKSHRGSDRGIVGVPIGVAIGVAIRDAICDGGGNAMVDDARGENMRG